MLSLKIVAVFILTVIGTSTCSVVAPALAPLPAIRYTQVAPPSVLPFSAQVSTFTKGLNVLAAPYAAGALPIPPPIVQRSVYPAPAFPVPGYPAPFAPVAAPVGAPLSPAGVPVGAPLSPVGVPVGAPLSPIAAPVAAPFAPVAPAFAPAPVAPGFAPVSVVAPSPLLPAPFARSIHAVAPGVPAATLLG